jgi:hypothetical protein
VISNHESNKDFPAHLWLMDNSKKIRDCDTDTLHLKGNANLNQKSILKVKQRKWYPCLIKRHTMNTYGVDEIQLNEQLTSA